MEKFNIGIKNPEGYLIYDIMIIIKCQGCFIFCILFQRANIGRSQEIKCDSVSQRHAWKVFRL